MKSVTVYTDGACSGNPGPGGWAAILMYGEHRRELSGGEPSTTNNRMELTAIISALSALKEPCTVELYSDSRYVLDALEKGWAARWRRNGWKRNKSDAALNPDLWEALLNLKSTTCAVTGCAATPTTLTTTVVTNWPWPKAGNSTNLQSVHKVRAEFTVCSHARHILAKFTRYTVKHAEGHSQPDAFSPSFYNTGRRNPGRVPSAAFHCSGAYRKSGIFCKRRVWGRVARRRRICNISLDT